MSAYGDIKHIHTAAPLSSTVWVLPRRDADSESNTGYITIHHLTLAIARGLPGLLEYLGGVFAKEIEDGLTYPQEGEMFQETFESYFFGADGFVAVAGGGSLRKATPDAQELLNVSVETERGERTWEDCIVGYYYIKPNYPGRSSHICNAGFVVPPVHRGSGFGSLLAKSYVHYAPLLGYQASVFNLVYVNNMASVKLWERLGFSKAGRIPRAGRLRTKDGLGEEYVDAWVFYKSFQVDESENNSEHTYKTVNQSG